MLLLAVLCIFLMRRIKIIEDQKFDLNEKLNLSDEEYISLFNENLKLAEELDTMKVLKRIKNL